MKRGRGIRFTPLRLHPLGVCPEKRPREDTKKVAICKRRREAAGEASPGTWMDFQLLNCEEITFVLPICPGRWS